MAEPIIRIPWRLPTAPLPSGAVDISAGVWHIASDQMVRTLFSGVRQLLSGLSGGVSWDFKNDEGVTVSGVLSDYEARLGVSNISSQFMSPVGCTSPLATTVSIPYDPRYPGKKPANSPVWYGFRRIHCLTVVGNKVYFGQAYAEGPPSHGFFTIDDIQTRRYYQTPPDAEVISQATLLGDADGDDVYHAGYDGYNLLPYFIYITSDATGEQKTRSAGVSLKVGHGITYRSALLPGGRIAGVAVQKTGNLLAVSLPELGLVKYYNKITLAFVRSVAFYKPGYIRFDQNDNLILAYAKAGAVDKTPVKIPGVIIGQPGFQSNQVRANAFDGNANTSYRSVDNEGWLGMNIPEGWVPTELAVKPVAGAEQKSGTLIEGSIGAGRFAIFDQTMVKRLRTIRRGTDPSTGEPYANPEAAPVAGQFTTYTFTNEQELRYWRIVQPGDYLVVTDLEMRGYQLKDMQVVERFTVANDGVMTTTNVTYGPIDRPFAIAITPDNARVSVLSGGADQVVWHFNLATGASQGYLGILGGHNLSPVCVPNRFYIDDRFGNLYEYWDIGTALAYQLDGKLLVGDNGNECVKRFNADGSFDTELAYSSKFYSSGINAADPRKIFVESKEYFVNYANTGVNNDRRFNWGAMFAKGIYRAARNVTTLSNGLTYCVLSEHSNGIVEKTTCVFEMGSTLRDTGERFFPGTELEGNGNLVRKVVASTGAQDRVFLSPLTGFSGGNLVHGSEALEAIGPVITDNDPQGQSNLTRTKDGWVKFDGKKSTSGGSKLFHLAYFKNGDTKLRARGARKLAVSQQTYALNGDFDEGGNVQVAGLSARTLLNGGDLDLGVWGFAGEGRYDSQDFYYQYYFNIGLFMKAIGSGARANPPEMSGVVQDIDYFKIDADTAIIGNSEEGGRGWCWRKITGLSSAQIIKVSLLMTV